MSLMKEKEEENRFKLFIIELFITAFFNVLQHCFAAKQWPGNVNGGTRIWKKGMLLSYLNSGTRVSHGTKRRVSKSMRKSAPHPHPMALWWTFSEVVERV